MKTEPPSVLTPHAPDFGLRTLDLGLHILTCDVVIGSRRAQTPVRISSTVTGVPLTVTPVFAVTPNTISFTTQGGTTISASLEVPSLFVRVALLESSPAAYV